MKNCEHSSQKTSDDTSSEVQLPIETPCEEYSRGTFVFRFMACKRSSAKPILVFTPNKIRLCNLMYIFPTDWFSFYKTAISAILVHKVE